MSLESNLEYTLEDEQNAGTIGEFKIHEGKFTRVHIHSKFFMDEDDIARIKRRIKQNIGREFFFARFEVDENVYEQTTIMNILIDIFPTYGPFVYPDGDLYHITKLSFLPEIQSKGFLPSSRDEDGLVIEQPRLYFCTDRDYVSDIHSTISVRGGLRFDDEYIVITLKNDGRSFYQDVECDCSVWTPEAYSAANILEIKTMYDFQIEQCRGYGR